MQPASPPPPPQPEGRPPMTETTPPVSPVAPAAAEATGAQVRVFSPNAGLIDGVPVTAPPYGDIQDIVISILQQRAQQLGAPTPAVITDDRYGGEIRLLVHPDGSTEQVG
ncbi:hypothetical protein SAVERM_4489 [Streptomyces avermitilis MA-4680 = NBRC 14893]|uniref:Uncharacterized protein n=1 Tax=Streptomyces avermitilis (strain ATCC 31267 / DSM 46492 / JCM 5070 / NBRC 14893 / NCIMB 12804 / NRRL 8165 / MA-4680) TaxID=227882 RepID=Q82EX4_STRAW|nr:hypothetical protein SAVERM_4489 [Streptomyces avermitilis MA-4680 = NBRC 14893]